MTARGFKTSSLIEAIQASQLDGVIAALDGGDDIELPDMHGYGGLPLRTACFEGNLAIVNELLKRGANPNTATSDGPGAPLRLALRRGHQDIVKLLQQQGATLTGESAIASATLILDAPLNPLPDEPAPQNPDHKPDNIIEFTPSGFTRGDTAMPDDDMESPGHFGTETNLLSMDLLFLEEGETPDLLIEPEKKP